MMSLGTLPDGTKGFDCNARVSRDVARKFYAAGYRFAVRYVRRSTAHIYDVNAGELVALLEAGLGFMIVQHVAAPGWMPTGTLGNIYGTVAAEEAQLVGVPCGTTLWCDLEGVSSSAIAGDVIAFCNAWHAAVSAARHEPGLYVGDSCGLTSDQLYRNTRFERYWAAYNLNRENFPAVRGVQLRQHPYPPPEQRVAGVPFEYDEDIIRTDGMGSTPILCMP